MIGGDRSWSGGGWPEREEEEAAVAGVAAGAPEKVKVAQRDEWEGEEEPEEGVWSPWTPWTPCTRPCGGGVTSQMRRCLQPSAAKR